MTDELTDEELARIDALAAAALSGPWECVAEERLSSDGEIAVFHHHVQVANDPDDPDDAGEFVLYGVEPSDRRTNFSPTERFVAESRTLVPRLVAALRSERTQREQLEATGLYLDPDQSPTESDLLRVKRARATEAAELRNAYTLALQARVERTGAELERERAQTRPLRAAANEVSDAWNEYIENDAPMDEVVDAIEMLRAALAAKEGTNG